MPLRHLSRRTWRKTRKAGIPAADPFFPRPPHVQAQAPRPIRHPSRQLRHPIQLQRWPRHRHLQLRPPPHHLPLLRMRHRLPRRRGLIRHNFSGNGFVGGAVSHYRVKQELALGNPRSLWARSRGKFVLSRAGAINDANVTLCRKPSQQQFLFACSTWNAAPLCFRRPFHALTLEYPRRLRDLSNQLWRRATQSRRQIREYKPISYPNRDSEPFSAQPISDSRRIRGSDRFRWRSSIKPRLPEHSKAEVRKSKWYYPLSDTFSTLGLTCGMLWGAADLALAEPGTESVPN